MKFWQKHKKMRLLVWWQNESFETKKYVLVLVNCVSEKQILKDRKKTHSSPKFHWFLSECSETPESEDDLDGEQNLFYESSRYLALLLMTFFKKLIFRRTEK